MTVEQSPLERFSNQKPQQQPPLLSSDKEVAAQSPTGGVIDLTNEDKEEDLKKAIALSLKEHERVLGGQVTMEDQDISRVIEASLAESKAVGTKRKRGEVWQDPLNPHDRQRNGDWPVGLKNVGNTCWFSAVIQSLFHLPIFRRLVLNYMPKEWDLTVKDPKIKRNLTFMQELRRLFALMQCSKRKYVDPSHGLEEFKEAFPDSGGTDSQQDVSEFSHKLLEWLEEAFKVNPYNGDSMMDGPEQNPMLDLFYGNFLSERHNEGRTFTNEETFGQYILQVNGFSNIHESLEAAMTQEIESYDVMTKSDKESWFTRLPPVMLFELSRFQFNQQLGRPEKIHYKLEFPQVMYMDRYMERNKNITRAIREKVRSLKDEREKLRSQLEKYLNYGAKKVPLHDVLQYTLDFAESKKCGEEMNNTSEDVEMASPASVSSMGGDSPCNSPNKAISMELVTNPSSSNEMVNHCEETVVPSPKHISELELKVLQSCLKRWRTEIESNVKNLQDSINNINNAIKEIYNDSSLKKDPYRLHAVLVHEGQAASGHYWAYVFSPSQNMWLKFNDVSVTEATWTELQKDSMGGHHYASAYCLLYVDELKRELFDETPKINLNEYKPWIFEKIENREVQIGPEYISSLPVDLQRYVMEDNEAFLVEMEQWDIEQSRKKDSSTMTMTDGECTIIALRNRKKEEISPVGPFVSRISMEHAILVHKRTLALVQQYKPPLNVLPDVLDELINIETLRIRRIARAPFNSDDDCRLHHIGVYMILNSSCVDPYLSLSVMEQFLIPELDEFPVGSIIKEAVSSKFRTMYGFLKKEQRFQYQAWHVDYHSFRKAVSYFVTGVESYDNNLPNALSAFIQCCEINQTDLLKPGSKRGLDQKLIQHYRRQSALKLNELVASQFETLDTKNALEALYTAYEYILPSMEFLASAKATDDDIQAAEIIRNRWCSMLGYDIASKPSAKQERLQDFLSKLIDPSNDIPESRPTIPKTILRVTNLEEKYRQAMKKVEESGELAAILKS